MTTLKNQPWFIAILAIIAGLLLGIWFGYQVLPRFQSGTFHNLSADQQDDYVILVALGYQTTHDLNAATDRLAQLNAPNKMLLVGSVLARAANQSRTEQELAALAQLDMDLGASKAVVERYLPTATPEPTDPPPPTSSPTATATPKPLPTATPEAQTPTAVPTHTSTPTMTATPQPVAIASNVINVRSGPGTVYPVIGSMKKDEEALIIAKNKTGDWWQVKLSDDRTGWVGGSVVTTQGDVDSILLAKSIPTPPPSPTSTPVATATPTAPSVDYVVKSIRLWGPVENGGGFDGPSLHCGNKRQLHAFVLDSNGQALNGVTLLGIYSHVEQVSGSFAPGVAAWVLGDGDGLRIIRDVDGSAVVSETADGMVTDPARISDETYIAAGYCTDHDSCQALRDSNACHGHYSWDVTFQRTH